MRKKNRARHTLLRGDKTVAKRWLPFAETMLRKMTKNPLRHSIQKHFTPTPNVLIGIGVAPGFTRIRIDARVPGGLYILPEIDYNPRLEPDYTSGLPYHAWGGANINDKQNIGKELGTVTTYAEGGVNSEDVTPLPGSLQGEKHVIGFGHEFFYSPGSSDWWEVRHGWNDSEGVAVTSERRYYKIFDSGEVEHIFDTDSYQWSPWGWNGVWKVSRKFPVQVVNKNKLIFSRWLDVSGGTPNMNGGNSPKSDFECLYSHDGGLSFNTSLLESNAFRTQQFADSHIEAISSTTWMALLCKPSPCVDEGFRGGDPPTSCGYYPFPELKFFKSEDAGETWSGVTGLSVFPDDGLPTQYDEDIYDPEQLATVFVRHARFYYMGEGCVVLVSFVATHQTDPDSDSFLDFGGVWRVFLSEDGGNSFTPTDHTLRVAPVFSRNGTSGLTFVKNPDVQLWTGHSYQPGFGFFRGLVPVKSNGITGLLSIQLGASADDGTGFLEINFLYIDPDTGVFTKEHKADLVSADYGFPDTFTGRDWGWPRPVTIGTKPKVVVPYGSSLLVNDDSSMTSWSLIPAGLWNYGINTLGYEAMRENRYISRFGDYMNPFFPGLFEDE